MGTYLWSTLANGRVINPFDANVDVLRVDDASISAAAVYGDFSDSSPTVGGLPAFTLTYGGKTVTVQMNPNPRAITTTNVMFDNGSLLLFGDNTTGTGSDNAANTLTGGSGNDQFFGLGGNDSLSGGSGDDLFTMVGDNLTGVLGDDTIAGGGGTDYLFYSQNARVGINVNFTIGFNDASGILGTVTGGDGMPGQGVPVPTVVSMVSVSGIEAVIGTNLADTFTASSLTPVSGLSSDIRQIFDGAGGNDTINGATGDGRITMLSYQNAPSGVTVNLGTGTASDGWGGTDTFNNIDGVRGSLFNDTLTGGSSSRIMTGGLSEFFEGMAGNDTIDGGGGFDTSIYSGNRASYTITKTSTGFIVSGGADGTDALTNIERLQFTDKKVALDLDGAAGMTAKILGAVFGAASVSNTQYVGIGLSYLDAGMTYQALMQLALNAKLGAGFSNAAEVNLLYQNIVGVLPSAADLSYWVGALTSGQFSQASLAVMAADLDLNKTNINLVGLAQTGIEFT